ncbi:MAG: hypothetical protein ACKOB4_11130, partial [Acidobacteriota bacterium]
MMVKGIIGQASGSIAAAARKLGASATTILVALLLFLLMLGAIFLFLTTRETNLWQILLGLVISPLLVVVIFFVGQAFAIHAIRAGIGAGYKLRLALSDALKLVVSTLPRALIVLLFAYLLPIIESAVIDSLGARAAAWVLQGLVWLSWILDGLIFPLLAINWWIVAVREGAATALRSTRRVCRLTFDPAAILIYLVTAGIYGFIAWSLFRSRPRIEREWLELTLFALRMALA